LWIIGVGWLLVIVQAAVVLGTHMIGHFR